MTCECFFFFSMKRLHVVCLVLVAVFHASNVDGQTVTGKRVPCPVGATFYSTPQSPNFFDCNRLWFGSGYCCERRPKPLCARPYYFSTFPQFGKYCIPTRTGEGYCCTHQPICPRPLIFFPTSQLDMECTRHPSGIGYCCSDQIVICRPPRTYFPQVPPDHHCSPRGRGYCCVRRTQEEVEANQRK